ncbi:hypothetical protein LDC_0885 [sediment metagenome]|uniref:Uncharacterized protein n=1 Tax=sediment metagenome TaxID=749907 RepID=D9PH85_9ZZZZ
MLQDVNKVMAYAMYMFYEWQEAGKITSVIPFTMTPDAFEDISILKARGFTPTKDELRQVSIFIREKHGVKPINS